MRLGHPRPTALTLGRAVAQRFALSKGLRLGVLHPVGPPGARPSSRPTPPALQLVALPIVPTHPAAYKRQRALSLFGEVFAVELVQSAQELHAVVDGRPVLPLSVTRSLQESFGKDLPAAEAALKALAESRSPERLAKDAYTLYTQFRPNIPEGPEGWGAKGPFELARVYALASGTSERQSV